MYYNSNDKSGAILKFFCMHIINGDVNGKNDEIV